jgi:GNAT superfamily N-acetyltransferase
MQTRIARPENAEQACNVIRRSIMELCVNDHRGDETLLQRWLANKTPGNVLAWSVSPDSRMLVAVEDDAIAGVASAAAHGEILLNYVSPDFRFRGVSKALICALETHLLAQGCRRVFLRSTLTAHAFYQAMGYRDCAPAETRGPMKAFPMEKLLG